MRDAAACTKGADAAESECRRAFFYDIYSEQEKESDPAKKDTGIFFFKGTSSAKYTICNTGDGFVYAGAMVSVSVPERLRKAG